MQYFGMGIITGAILHLLSQKVKEDKYNQERIELYYERRAEDYAKTDQQVGLLGYNPRIQLRQQLLDQMALQPGDTVLDMACGTGSNFPYIMERIGPSGHLVATDFSAPMLEEAQRLVDRQGWQNVELVQSDAATLHLGRHFDATLATLALIVIPDYEQALERLWEHLRPGGVIGIADLCVNERPYMQPFNFIMDWLDATLITDVARRPWEWLARHAEDYERQDLLLGYMYTATGRKPHA